MEAKHFVTSVVHFIIIFVVCNAVYPILVHEMNCKGPLRFFSLFLFTFGSVGAGERGLFTKIPDLTSQSTLLACFQSVVPRFPLLGLTPSGLYMGSISTLIYTYV